MFVVGWLVATASGTLLRGFKWGCTGTPSLVGATSMGAFSQAIPRATANAGAGDRGRASESLPRFSGRGEQHSSLGQLLATFPPPVAMHSPSPDVDATTQALGMMSVNARRGLDGLGELLRRATRKATRGCSEFTNTELQALKRLAKLINSCSTRTVGGEAAVLDDLHRALPLCCDPIAEDILTHMGGVARILKAMRVGLGGGIARRIRCENGG